MKREALERIRAARAAGRAVVLVTWLEDGRQRVLEPLQTADPDALVQAAREAVLEDRSRVVTAGGSEVFLQVYNPPLRLIVIGAVHIAQALAPMAALAGFAVVIVDPRRAFAMPERFPDVEVVAGWPEDVLPDLGVDHRTALVTLSHDPKLDDPALRFGLRSPAFYVGALGSRRTHERRVKRLREAGFDDDEVARIRAPVGLDIGASTPAEIAVATLAEVVAARHGSA